MMIRLVGCAVLTASATLLGADPAPGILDQPAPTWSIDQWINLPEGAKSLDVHDLRGKVIYLYGFQAWCPGCHSHGFPALKQVMSRFKGDTDVAFVAVQTVFEGFGRNTFDRVKEIAQRYDLDIPIGHSGQAGRASELTRRYRSGGTPWTVIIDRNGIVRFNAFKVVPDQAERLMRTLRARPASGVPASRGGWDMIGKPLPLDDVRWLNTPDRKPIVAKGKVTLVRWWTDTCSYCERSLPAITKLHRQYAERGFQTVAVYHPKPPRPVVDATVIEIAKHWDYTGPIAVDRNWDTLTRLYLSKAERSATSVSFLLDRDGIVRFVHPGPVFAPTDKPAERQLNRDYIDLKTAIEALLDQPVPKKAAKTK
jgi:thiol-disulfide isomerase/thioredoxin